MAAFQGNLRQPAPTRISISARLGPALSYMTAMFGAALGSLLISRMFEGMRDAESAGIAAVAGGLAESNVAALVALCLATLVGIIGIAVLIARAFISTTTTSPSSWFYLITGGLSLVPLALVWEAQTLIVQAISAQTNITVVASLVRLCLTVALVTAAAFALMLLIVSLAPLPAILRAKRAYAPILVVALMELLLIGMTIAFTLRASYLYKVKDLERFF
jgi:hypothetical protein